MLEPQPETITVYVSIGNSDDELAQLEWSAYAATFVAAIKHWAGQIHGIWYSVPDSPYQNACACFEIVASQEPLVKDVLATTARVYRQDSIAWAVATTEFITAADRA